MSWKPHQTISRRRKITLTEWAAYLGVSRRTVRAWIDQYNYVNKNKKYDARDTISLLRFLDFVRDTK